MSTENALLTILVEKINNDTLVLPTLPAIALKVRKAADDPKINLAGMGDVIAQDQSLSDRMIKIANSAYLGRTVKVSSISQAVTRIGLTQIKNISTALAMEQLFVSKNDLVKNYLKQAWDHTVNVVANAMASMQLYAQTTKQRHLSLDTMTLAALVHNIGILPILTEAERHADVFANPTFLDVAIQKLSGRIGGKIMHEWGFGEEFAIVSENWRNMQYQMEEVSYIDFVRLGAVLAGQMGSEKDTIFNLSMQKQMFADIHQLDADEYLDMRDSVKAIFD